MNVMTNDDPEPIYIVKDVDDNDKKPLFLNKEEGEDDLIPILPSPGYDVNNYVIDPYQSPGIPSSGVSSPILHSIKEPDSDGNSMGVLYQSTVGSVNLDNREGNRNDLGSRLNSPLISGRVADSSMIQMDPLNLDPGRFSSTPFGDTKGFFLSPTFDYPTTGRPTDADVPYLSSTEHIFDMNTQHSERQANLYQSILQEPSKSNLSYPNPFSSFPYQQQGVGFSSPSYSSTQPTRSPTPSSFYKPKANEREQYRESIPAYVYDTIQQHNGKPHWFQYLTGAKNVRVPLLQASSLFYQSLLDVSRDVFMIEGILDGCTYPLSSLTLPYYIKELGCYYDASVQTLEGMQFKCRLSICNALYQLQQWKVCIILESSSSNHLASYSHGTIIKDMDWVERLNEFEKKERPKNRDSSNIVTPKTILFMTQDSLYDSRHIFAIPNSIVYVQSGVIRVYYYPIDGKIGTESFQNSSQLLTSFSLVMYVEVKEGHHLFIPSGRLFIIQAVTQATVIISRFLCGLQLKRQITSYRQLYNDNYDESFKWQFWKVNWLAAFMYLRGLRISQGVKVDPCCLQDAPISTVEKMNIPFLIVALKILHEIYGSKQNSLQQFEVCIAEKVGCLGPLDALMELSTRCRDNLWNMNGHRLQHPDAISTTSEDTMAVMDVSPYPDSIDSNEFIDDYVEDASIQEEHKENSEENWEFRCLCGVEGHNYDDGKEMVQCSKCHVWCHCECVHYDLNSNSDFYCPWCVNR